MNVVFRVDASSVIGSGHLSRCLTLARAFANAGDIVTFATRAPTEHTRKWVARAGHRIVEIEGASEVDASRAAVSGADLVVIDGYTFDAELHGALRAPKRVVCVVDDTATSPIGGDVVLNGNLFAEALDYGNIDTIVGP